MIVHSSARVVATRNTMTTKRVNPRHAVLLCLLLTVPALAVAEETPSESKAGEPAASPASIIAAAGMQWADGPASLPRGTQMVVLDGNPAKEGSFTIRLKMPAGYRIPPHTHPTAERVTVISGTVLLGLGEKLDEGAAREMKAGDFAVVPAGVPHFAAASSEAVLQIHSEGPFQRQFVD